MYSILRGFVFSCTLLLAGVATASPLPAPGTMVENTIQVGNNTVPLPTGQWLVLSSCQKIESRKADVKKTLTGHLGVLSVVLAQSTGSQGHSQALSGFVIVEASANYEPENVSDSRHSHDETQQYYKESFYTSTSARGKPSHLTVGPHFLCPKDCGGAIKKYMKENNIAQPTSALAEVGFMFARHGGFLMVQYFFNPEINGVSLDSATAKNGQWHPEAREDLDEKQKQYLDKLTVWAQDMKTRFGN